MAMALRLLAQGNPSLVFALGFRPDRVKKERSLCEKTDSNYFPILTKQARLMRNLFSGFSFPPSSLLVLSLSWEVPV